MNHGFEEAWTQIISQKNTLLGRTEKSTDYPRAPSRTEATAFLRGQNCPDTYIKAINKGETFVQRCDTKQK